MLVEVYISLDYLGLPFLGRRDEWFFLLSYSLGCYLGTRDIYRFAGGEADCVFSAYIPRRLMKKGY